MPNTGSYRDRVLQIFSSFVETHNETVQLIAGMTPEQQQYKIPGQWSAAETLEHLVKMQTWISRMVLVLTWFRPLLIKFMKPNENEQLDVTINGAKTETVIFGFSKPRGKADIAQLISRDTARIRTFRQRMNCFEHNEWFQVGFYHPGLNKFLTIVQWLAFLRLLEQHHQTKIRQLLQQQNAK